MSRHLSSADISIFLPEINKFSYIKKYRYRLHFGTQLLFLLMLFESLRIILTNMATILMMSAKMLLQAFLKYTYFEVKVMSSYSLPMTSPTVFYYVTHIILQMRSYDQSLITIALLLEKLSQPQVFKDLIRKPNFFEGPFCPLILNRVK